MTVSSSTEHAISTTINLLLSIFPQETSSLFSLVDTPENGISPAYTWSYLFVISFGVAVRIKVRLEKYELGYRFEGSVRVTYKGSE